MTAFRWRRDNAGHYFVKDAPRGLTVEYDANGVVIPGDYLISHRDQAKQELFAW